MCVYRQADEIDRKAAAAAAKKEKTLKSEEAEKKRRLQHKQVGKLGGSWGAEAQAAAPAAGGKPDRSPHLVLNTVTVPRCCALDPESAPL